MAAELSLSFFFESNLGVNLALLGVGLLLVLVIKRSGDSIDLVCTSLDCYRDLARAFLISS